MELRMDVSQALVMSQKMIQSTEILQMGSLELENYIKDLSMENPVVDLEDGYDGASKDESETRETTEIQEDVVKKLEWLNSSDEQNRVYYSQDYDVSEIEQWNFSVDEDEDLTHFIMSQLVGAPIDEAALEIISYMVLSLDSKGYLNEDFEDMALRFGVSEDEIEKCLHILQGLEPAGVGACNLKECLMLQLDRMDVQDAIVRTIVGDYLEQLGKNQLHVIAKKMKVSLDEVSEAVKVIKALNPKPGRGFSSREKLKYITPDVTVVRLGGYYEILLNEYAYPRISINSYYLKLLKSDAPKETKTYVTEKVHQAEWIKNCIQQRNKTLLNVTKTIIDMQQTFFAAGPGNLKPMKLVDVAEILGVHESTVSRAVKDKYMQCSWGVYPLNYFFSKGIATMDMFTKITPEDVKKAIREIIDGEDKKKPLSDRKISEALAEREIALSRRTVAKYREEEGIKDASGRKVFD